MVNRDTTRQNNRNRITQLVGLVLWRTGLLIAAASALYHSIEFALRFVNLPRRLEVGVGLIIAGIVLVAASFIMERIADYRREGDLNA